MTGQPNKQYDRVVRTVCSPNDHATCGVNAFVKDGRVVKLEPASYPRPGFERICLRGITMATQRLHHPDRLRHPLIRTGERGEGKWREVSWDEAYDYIIARQAKATAEHGSRANAWLSGSGNVAFHAGNAAARVANDLEGSVFSFFGLSGDFAGMAGFAAVAGSMCWANDISEIGGATYFLSVGRNVCDTAHSEMHFIFDAMENGTKFVMIDPRYSRSVAKADEWLAPRPGTDAALAMGMLNVIIGEGLMKTDYVTAHTNLPFLVDRTSRKVLREHDLTAGGSDEALVWDEASDRPLPVSLAQKPALRKSATLIAQDRSRIDFCTAFDASWDVLKTFTPEYASQICEVPAAQIVHVAKEYASHERPWIWFGLGPQRYHHGHSVARAWLTLTAVCGNIGKPYAGISMYDGPNIVFATIPHSEWLEPGGRKSSPLPGTQMVDILRRQAPYPVKTLWLAMYGFATQGPQFKRFLTEALPNLDLLVVNEQMMTPAAEYADVVLPTVSYYEDDWDLVGSGESWWVQLRRQAVEPIGSSRSDFDIYKGLCERMGRGDAWQMEKEESCRHIMRTHPDPRIRAVDWESLRENGVAEVPVERPYTPFRDMKFNTPSGRMELYQEQFIDVGEEVLVFKEQAESRRSERARAYPLNLITYKVVHSAHSTHLMLPYIREQLPEPRLDVSPVDAAARGIEDGDWVTAFNDRGKFTVRASISSTLRSGTVAMPAGWWQRFFRNGHPADLGHIPLNEIQERIAETNYPNWDVLCQLRKADES